jgi:hypothetical protein
MTWVKCSCYWCGKTILKTLKEVNRSMKLGRKFFCNNSCSCSFTNSKKPVGMSKTRLRVRARKLWIQRHKGQLPMCWCGKPADIHHVDGDPTNNSPSNHEPLCRSHHVAYENSTFPKRKKACKRFTLVPLDAGAAPATSTRAHHMPPF